jgi:WD40 repeat protein
MHESTALLLISPADGNLLYHSGQVVNYREIERLAATPDALFTAPYIFDSCAEKGGVYRYGANGQISLLCSPIILLECYMNDGDYSDQTAQIVDLVADKNLLFACTGADVQVWDTTGTPVLLNKFITVPGGRYEGDLVILSDEVDEDEFAFTYCAAVNGDLIALGCQQGAVKIYNWRDGTEVLRFNTGLPDESPNVFAIAVNNNRIVTSIYGDDTLCLWDTATGECLDTFLVDEVPEVARLALRGNELYVGTDSGRIMKLILE